MCCAGLLLFCFVLFWSIKALSLFQFERMGMNLGLHVHVPIATVLLLLVALLLSFQPLSFSFFSRRCCRRSSVSRFSSTDDDDDTVGFIARDPRPGKHMTCMGTRTVPFPLFFVLSDSRNGRYPQHTHRPKGQTVHHHVRWAVRSFCLSFFLANKKRKRK